MTTTADLFADLAWKKAPRQDVPRHPRWGGPMILDPYSGKRVYHRRPSKVAKELADQGRLQAWDARMTMVGTAYDATIANLVKSTDLDNRDALDKLARRAKDVARTSQAADEGTIRHALCEHVDLGGDVEAVPVEFRDDIAAYMRATDDLWDVVALEQFVVADAIRCAGSCDRYVLRQRNVRAADVKTSRHDPMQFGGPEHAIQLAIYAHGAKYDDETGIRTPLPIDTTTGYVIWLPQGKAKCVVYEVDLVEAWEWTLTTMRLYDWRKAASRIMTPVAES